MKHRKIITAVLAVALVVSVIGCLASFTMLKDKSELNGVLDFTVRPDADPVRILNVDDPEINAVAEPEINASADHTNSAADDGQDGASQPSTKDGGEQAQAGAVYETPEQAGPGGDFVGEIKLALDGSELKYKETVKTESASADIYVDNNNNKYTFDLDGHLLQFSGNEMTLNVLSETKQQGGKLGEDDAVRAADDFAARLFGKELFAEFGFDEAMSVGNEKGDQWFVFYRKECEGISLAEISVKMLADGTVYDASLYNYYFTADFTPDMLAGQTAESFSQRAMNEFLKGADPESRGCRVINVSLRHGGERWYVKVSIEYEKPYYDIAYFEYELDK